MAVNVTKELKKINREANIKQHTILSDIYESHMPHFHEDSKKKVECRLREYAMMFGNTELLDLGCGTGFILDIAKHIFLEVVGVDITQAMLDQVKVSDNVSWLVCDTDELTFSDNTFNVVTACAFLHHLYDLEQTLKEAYRVLQPGGMFWSSYDPNYHYWEAVKNSQSEYNNTVLQRERSALSDVLTNHAKLGIPEETLLASEIWQCQHGGIKPEDLAAIAYRCGFSTVAVGFGWFLGEAEEADRDTISTYLRKYRPVTKHLFKYLSMEATK